MGVHQPLGRLLSPLRARLKVALVRSRSATAGGVSRFESKLQYGAQGFHPGRLELPPLVVRSRDGRGLISLGPSIVVEASPRLLREVPDAHILSTGGMILSRDRRFITENVYGDEPAALRHNALSAFARTFSPVEGWLDVVFSLLGPYSHNYFHWLIDHLPKVEDYLLWQRTLAPNAKLLVPPGPWQFRLLELLGVGREQCIALRLAHARAKVAAVASYPVFPAAERLMWLRSRLFDALGLTAQPGTRKIFISRRDSALRPLANEDEVAQALQARGFETVILRNLEIDDQVRLFASAGTVVAAHGAGLTNLLFSTAPTVIELFPPDWIRRDFQALTLFSGGRHIGVFLQGSRGGGDLRVDVHGLLCGLAEASDPNAPTTGWRRVAGSAACTVSRHQTNFRA